MKQGSFSFWLRIIFQQNKPMNSFPSSNGLFSWKDGVQQGNDVYRNMWPMGVKSQHLHQRVWASIPSFVCSWWSLFFDSETLLIFNRLVVPKIKDFSFLLCVERVFPLQFRNASQMDCRMRLMQPNILISACVQFWIFSNRTVVLVTHKSWKTQCCNTLGADLQHTQNPGSYRNFIFQFISANSYVDANWSLVGYMKENTKNSSDSVAISVMQQRLLHMSCLFWGKSP